MVDKNIEIGNIHTTAEFSGLIELLEILICRTNSLTGYDNPQTFND